MTASSSSTDAKRQPGRHRARRNAMMVLYKLDLLPGDVDSAIQEWVREHDFELPAYARQLIETVDADRERIDATLTANLQEWSLERLGAVERNILRIAMCELLGDDVPHEVAIDEAIELAKRYASPEAAKLVNGVLGGYVRGRGTS